MSCARELVKRLSTRPFPLPSRPVTLLCVWWGMHFANGGALIRPFTLEGLPLLLSKVRLATASMCNRSPLIFTNNPLRRNTSGVRVPVCCVAYPVLPVTHSTHSNLYPDNLNNPDFTKTQPANDSQNIRSNRRSVFILHPSYTSLTFRTYQASPDSHSPPFFPRLSA